MESFRNINVDIWEEDALLESELVPAYHLDPSAAQHHAQETSNQVRGLINRSDPTGALQVLLSSPPYGPDPDYAQPKETTLSTLLVVLNSVKSTEIASHLRSLDIDQKDTLMKWIYKGLARPDLGSSGVLLGWHEKLTEVAGTGCIVRVMTDRRKI